jgi:hypothetical protein
MPETESTMQSRAFAALIFLAAICGPLQAADEPPAATADAAEPPAAPTGGDAAGPGGETAAATADLADSAALPSREDELAALLPRLTREDELLWLEAGAERFFAFRREPRGGKSRGGILIVPAPGRFIDELPLVRRLREDPPVGGYTTLAVQAPLATAPAAPSAAAVDEAGADAARGGEEARAAASTVPEAGAALCARIAAALAALSAEGVPMVALAAGGGSADAVLACEPGGLPAGVAAFAAIGRWEGRVKELAVPSIEFVPTRDPTALAAAERRADARRADTAPPHRRIDIDAADGRFDGAEEEVAKRLRGWLEKLPAKAAATAAR